MQKQLEDKEVQYQQQTIKARAVSAFQQAGVVQSEHMYALLKDKLRLKDGAVVGLDGGVGADLGSSKCLRGLIALTRTCSAVLVHAEWVSWILSNSGLWSEIF